MKSEQHKQKASISVAEEVGFITNYFHTRTGCPWRMSTWKVVCFQTIQTQMRYAGLRRF